MIVVRRTCSLKLLITRRVVGVAREADVSRCEQGSVPDGTYHTHNIYIFTRFVHRLTTPVGDIIVFIIVTSTKARAAAHCLGENRGRKESLSSFLSYQLLLYSECRSHDLNKHPQSGSKRKSLMDTLDKDSQNDIMTGMTQN